MTQETNNGIVHLVSIRSVSDVLDHLLALLHTKAVKVFAVVDHSGEAAKAGFEMPETKLVIFGNPKAGTPLMIAAPDSALDLPLKILIAQHADSMTRVSYNDPSCLGQRYGLSADLLGHIAVIEQIAAAIAG